MFWNQERRTRVFWALLIGLCLGLLLYLFFGNRQQASFFSGDFPAFYAAGYIVAQGWGHELYNYDLQRNIENLFWPDFDGEMYIFAYPPFVAAILAPLGFLAPLSAKFFFNAMLAYFMFLALVILRKHSPALTQDFRLSFLLALSFSPVFVSIVGAQNTAISMLLYAAMVAAGLRRTHMSDFVLGICAGLFMYKPQYALTTIPVALILGRHRALFGVMLVAAFYYLLGAAVQGFFWPLLWLEEANRFGNINFTINADIMISVVGGFYALSSFLSESPERSLILGYIISGILLFSYLIYCLKTQTKEGSRLSVLCLMGPVMVLVSPQALFYDLGILVVAVMPFLSFERTKLIWAVILFWLLGGALGLLRYVSETPNYFFLALLITLFVCFKLRRGEETII